MRLGRRELGVLVGCSILGAGCLDLVRGEAFVARPAPVAASALDETGYDHYRTVEIEETHTVEAGGVSREIDVVNVRSEYDRRVDLGPLGETRAAVFTTLSTPKIEVLGRTFNPVEGMDNQEVADELQSRYEEISIGTEIDRRTLTVLGDSIDVSKFTGEATFSEMSVDVFAHIGIAETDDGYVLLLAVYPRLLTGEEETITALIRGVTIEDDRAEGF